MFTIEEGTIFCYFQLQQICWDLINSLTENHSQTWTKYKTKQNLNALENKQCSQALRDQDPGEKGSMRSGAVPAGFSPGVFADSRLEA